MDTLLSIISKEYEQLFIFSLIQKNLSTGSVMVHASKKGNLYRLPFFEAWIGPGSAECIIQFTISKSTVPYKIKALCVNQN